jgi:hypothetical protein
MLCPSCKCEFRSGFTRCEGCGVDLVEDLVENGSTETPIGEGEPDSVPEPTSVGPVPMAEYCGFLELDEARSSRDQLRTEGIRSEILIRDAPAPAGTPPIEEFWLRVEVARIKSVQKILGFDPAEPVERADVEREDDESFECGGCGKTVSATESRCPHCGASLDDA